MNIRECKMGHMTVESDKLDKLTALGLCTATNDSGDHFVEPVMLEEGLEQITDVSLRKWVSDIVDHASTHEFSYILMIAG